MENRINYRKLILYVVITFIITYGCWWTLVPLAMSGSVNYGDPLFMSLWLIGGAGPTLAPFIAIAPIRR